ncbi:MAG: CRISPR-associated helicase Cas3' [Planctomycetota bacterium]|nr:CRISPR-associated helicase Cas3' [Planctomycetota bacterium]
MNEADTRLLWAKLGRDSDAYPSQAHPVVCHLLDVQHVAEQLWLRSIGGGLQNWLADELQISVAVAGGWIAVWVAAHDLGKMSPDFQMKAAKANPSLAPTLESAGFNCATGPVSKSIPHGQITAVTLPQILEKEFGVPRPLACVVSHSSGGHHGRFLKTGEQRDLERRLKADPRPIGAGRWDEARREAVSILVRNAGIDRRNEWPVQQVSSAWLMALAGLTTVSDWIGSMLEFFKPAGVHVDLAEYVPLSRKCAAAAVDQLGWAGWKAPKRSLSLEELFPVIRQYGARPLQTLVEELKPQLAEPSLVLIEAPMGEGKTEAAMALADHWAATCHQRGCYFALPTMATSNQMFGRVREFLEHRYGDRREQVNLLLLHGRASLSEALCELLVAARRVQPSGLSDDAEHHDRSDAAVIASEWFTYRKRGLLAPFGVGTIDQTLMAVLRTKHVFVRLFGLAHKTVIIDEVHAYDAYMNELLTLLLRWLRSLGSSVVLLSATLPESTRRRLLAAYAGCDDPDDCTWDSSANVPYPRLSWIADGTVHARQFAATQRVSLRLDRHPDDVTVWGPALNVALRDGGCAAVICNTVAQAQNTYRALSRWFVPDELDLFHARFPFDEREQREARTLERFGPTDDPRIRPRRVLVATQVIEQSLDLDFDLMLTQHAPADLVLQRAGRLHRHVRVSGLPRQRPTGCGDPTLWLLEPLILEDTTPDFGSTGYVYDRHVLLRSWLVLTGRVELRVNEDGSAALVSDSISMPDDIEPLIEAVYAESSECPPDLSAPLQRMWAATREASESDTLESAEDARQRLISQPRDRHEGSVSKIVDPAWLMDEDSPELNKAFRALTRRETRPSVSIVCLYESPEGLRLDLDGPLVDLNSTHEPASVERFIRRSVSLSKRSVTSELLKNSQVPRAWERVGLLRSLHVVRFDSVTREAHVGAQQLILHPQLGIVFPEQLDEEP